MTTENEREVYRALRTGQDKYTYLMLTAAGAAIAFATTQTKDASLTWSQIPLGIAVALWGVSFFAGCMYLRYVNSALIANIELLKVQRGEHPMAGSHPQVIDAASEGIFDALHRNRRMTALFERLQFRALIFGAAFYVGWHVIEMYLRVAPSVAVGP